jgi:hypothetical protein
MSDSPKPFFRVFLDGAESWPREDTRNAADVLNDVVGDHPEAQWIVVVGQQNERACYDRAKDAWLL